MTAGGRRPRRARRRRWGETAHLLAPTPPPEGIDLVIEKLQTDDELLRRSRQLQMEDRQARGDLANLADDLADLTQPERDHVGRVVVDRTHALIGAVVVAVVLGLTFWVVAAFLTGPSSSP